MVIASGAFKRAEVEPYARGHNAREHHIGMALRAGGAVDMNVDGIGQGTGFRHDASLDEAGAQHSLSPVVCPGEVTVMEPAFLTVSRFRWSILNSLKK
jgi:hypothetical protein